jgi:hypothetical protein
MTMRFGVDYYSDVQYSPETLKQHDWSFTARYLSHQEGKALVPAEALLLSKGGIDLVVVFEDSATAISGGFNAGEQNAQFALEQAIACGMKGSRPIYFAVDEDTTPEPTATFPYFEGVASVIGLARTGAYGGYSTISNLFNAKKITWGWQTYAWSNGRWDARAQLQQYQDGEVYDLDRAVAEDFGQWRAGVYKAPPAPDTYAVLTPDERKAAEQYVAELKVIKEHPHSHELAKHTAVKLKEELVTMRKEIWTAAQSGSTEFDPAGWNVADRVQRYEILLHLTEGT